MLTMPGDCTLEAERVGDELVVPSAFCPDVEALRRGGAEEMLFEDLRFDLMAGSLRYRSRTLGNFADLPSPRFTCTVFDGAALRSVPPQ